MLCLVSYFSDGAVVFTVLFVFGRSAADCIHPGCCSKLEPEIGRASLQFIEVEV